MSAMKPQLLVVDDEQDTCANLADIFTDLGYDVDVAYDGFSALALVEHKTYDVALLDLKMPRRNGFEVLEWIRQQSSLSSLRVVVLTSSDEIRDVNRAYQLGANAYMVKPTTAEALERLIQTISDFWYAGEKPLAPEQSASPTKPS